jgi:restriction system protein
VAFVAVFVGTIAGVILVWLGATGARSRSAKTLDGLLALSPSDFEIAVGRLLRRQGYRDVSVVGGSGDLAADILCRARRGGVVAVQCKRKAPGQRVGSAELQRFIGMISVHHGANAGIFVTTSSYTQPAVELAAAHEILLVDGAMLSELVRGKRRLATDVATKVA